MQAFKAHNSRRVWPVYFGPVTDIVESRFSASRYVDGRDVVGGASVKRKRGQFFLPAMNDEACARGQVIARGARTETA